MQSCLVLKIVILGQSYFEPLCILSCFFIARRRSIEAFPSYSWIWILVAGTKYLIGWSSDRCRCPAGPWTPPARATMHYTSISSQIFAIESTQVGRTPLSNFQPSPLWGNKYWPPSMKVKKLENLGNKIGSKGCIWSNLNAPCNQSTQVGRIPLSHFQPSPLWGNKNWPPSMKVKKL